MSMFGPKYLSHILFYLFRGLSIFGLLSVIYYDVSFLIENFRHENDRYLIDIPLIGTFMKGEFQFNVILTVSLTLIFIIIFFFVLSNIFKALKEDVVFNHKTIKNLHYFTVLNLGVGPALYLLVHYVIMQKENYRDIHNLILLILFGVVALFLTTTFKKGVHVQNENDLTI
ncbi:DUF2975 domain-containing protein [Maribacter antarcticus]|uniref:DUF2975 domain-containing protein n=1 Tax=Maribacter antarcticus TaxID=505250 RepID=UPI000A55066E|nr:DUF2975 domain-containing protein [Maribacter antarcticus]